MDDLLRAALQLQHGLEDAQALLNDRIRASFKGMSIDAIRRELAEDPTGVLQYLIETGSESEHYEICAAARLVLEERNKEKKG